MLCQTYKNNNENNKYVDCTGCLFVWKNVEEDVGDAHMDDDIVGSFRKICAHAKKTAIFYPVVRREKIRKKDTRDI